MNIVAATSQTGRYSAFLAALAATDLCEKLEGVGPFTVFAPDDAAFEKFSTATMSGLLQGDRTLLTAVLSYHFAIGEVSAARFAGRRIRATTFAGQTLLIDGKNGLAVNGASVIEPDIKAANGIIHGIDRVLWPAEPAILAGAA